MGSGVFHRFLHIVKILIHRPITDSVVDCFSAAQLPSWSYLRVIHFQCFFFAITCSFILWGKTLSLVCLVKLSMKKTHIFNVLCVLLTYLMNWSDCPSFVLVLYWNLPLRINCMLDRILMMELPSIFKVVSRLLIPVTINERLELAEVSVREYRLFFYVSSSVWCDRGSETIYGRKGMLLVCVL